MFQSILIVAIDHSLAIVTNPQPIVGVVDAVVTLKADQDNSRPGGDVAIIRYIEQLLVVDLSLDPVVEHRHHRLEVNFLGVFHQEFYIDVVQFHEALFLTLTISINRFLFTRLRLPPCPAGYCNCAPHR